MKLHAQDENIFLNNTILKRVGVCISKMNNYLDDYNKKYRELIMLHHSRKTNIYLTLTNDLIRANDINESRLCTKISNRFEQLESELHKKITRALYNTIRRCDREKMRLIKFYPSINFVHHIDCWSTHTEELKNSISSLISASDCQAFPQSDSVKTIAEHLSSDIQNFRYTVKNPNFTSEKYIYGFSSIVNEENIHDLSDEFFSDSEDSNKSYISVDNSTGNECIELEETKLDYQEIPNNAVRA